jgi:hypothetical protein
VLVGFGPCGPTLTTIDIQYRIVFDVGVNKHRESNNIGRNKDLDNVVSTAAIAIFIRVAKV